MRPLLRLIPYLRKEWKSLCTGCLSIIAGNLLAVAAWDRVMAAVDSFAAPGTTASEVLRGAVVSLGLFLLAAIFRFLMRYFISGASRRMEFELRNDLFAKLLSLSPSYYDRRSTGDIMSRATNDLEAVRSVLGPGLLYPINAVVLLPSVLLLMFKISPTLTLLSLLPLAVGPILVRSFNKVTHRRFKEIQRFTGDMSERVREHLTGIRIVKAFCREEIESQRFLEMNREYRSRQMALAKVQGVFFPLLRLVVAAGQVLIVYFGLALMESQGGLTYGGLFAFIGLHAELAWPMIAFGWVTNVLERGAASMARLAEIFDAQSPVPSPAFRRTRSPSVPRLQGRIVFADLSFSYNGRVVLKGLNLQVEPGSTVGIVGPVGCGKTTLLRLIARLYPVERGHLFLDGCDINDLPVDLLRNSLGVVPQEPFLFSETIRENIYFGLAEDKRDERRLAEVVRRTELASEIESFPDGLDTLLGERGINLSGGQKQRVCLARALIRNPPILLLDDCLSAVDVQTEKRILNHLRKELTGRTALLVSHRVSTVAAADRIYVFDEGRIVEEGTHTELIALGGLYAKLAERQRLLEELEGGSEANNGGNNGSGR